MNPTWRERAQLVIAASLRESVAAGHTEKQASAAASLAFLSSSMYGGAAYPSKVFREELRLALRRLRDGADPEALGPCATCGAADLTPCKPLNGEILPGEYHQARGPRSKLEMQVAEIVAQRATPEPPP